MMKLIICQIRHELSVTIHEISTSWKKKTLDGGLYIITITTTTTAITITLTIFTSTSISHYNVNFFHNIPEESNWLNNS